MAKAVDRCIFCDDLPCSCNKKKAPPKKVYQAKVKADPPVAPKPTPKERTMSTEQRKQLTEESELRAALAALAPILAPQEQIKYNLPLFGITAADRSAAWRASRAR